MSRSFYGVTSVSSAVTTSAITATGLKNQSGTVLLVTAGASQTGDLQRWTNASATPLSRMDAAGSIGIGTGTVSLAGQLHIATDGTGSSRGLVLDQHNAGTDAAQLILRKSRGTLASPEAVSSGDGITSIIAEAYNNGTYLPAASIDLTVDAGLGSTDMPGKITFSTTAVGDTVATERMSIDEAGTVRIGSDVVGPLTSSSPTTLAIGDSPVTGTGLTAARADHVHGMPAFGSVTAVASGDAAADGSAATVSHSDHSHGLPTSFAPGAFGSVTAQTSYGLSSGDGSASTVSHSDHTHGTPSLTSSTPSTQAIGDSAVTGTGTTPARDDHKHGMPSFGAVTAQTSYGASSGNGSAATVPHSDHTHGTPSLTTNAASTQAIGDAATVGTGTAPAKDDHKHGMPAFGSVTAVSPGDAATDGTAATVSHSDHNHGLSSSSSASIIAACRVATTANITLSGTQTIDGVAAIAGDRVLVKAQSTAADDGVYVCAAGAWSRATDVDNTSPDTELITGSLVPVSEGTLNADTVWMLTTDGAITIGTTALSFSLVGALPGTPGNSAVGDSASAGTSNTFARSGHVHGREAFGAVSAQTSYGASSGNGSATTVSHSDHTHGTPSLTSNAASTQAIGDTATVGTGTAPARDDHKHGLPSFATPGSSAVGDVAAGGSAATLARSDHVHGREAFGSVTAQTSYGLSSGNGSAATLAHSDHTHGTPSLTSSTPSTQAIGDAAAVGTGTAPAKDDHKHGMPSFGSVVAVSMGDVAADGSAATVSHSDHSHGLPGSISSFIGTCRVATTANITLSGTQTIDGVSVVAGDRVLVKAQSTGADDGVYVCAAGAWSRATDVDNTSVDTELKTGALVPVSEGTVNADTVWMLTTNGAITIGTTALSFSLVGALPGTPGNSAVADAAAAGTTNTFARSDHVHGREAFGAATAQTSYGLSSGNGSATTLSHSDHTHGTPALSSNVASTQAIGDSATNGSGTAPAKDDHKHGMPAFAAVTTVAWADAAADGSAATLARSDHNHGLPTTVPTSFTVTSGNLSLDNNQSIRWKDSGGTYRVLAKLDSSNTFYVGDSANAFSGDTYLAAGVGGSINFKTAGNTRGVIDSSSLRLSGIPFQLDNNQPIKIKDSGATARTIVNVDGSNNVLFGDTGNTFTADTTIGAGIASSIHFKSGGSDRGIIDSNSLRILALSFQLDNTQAVKIKDSGGTARTVVSMDGSNQVLVGDTGNTYTGDTYLAAGTSSSIHFKTAGSDRGIIDSSSLRLSGIPFQLDNNQPIKVKDSGGTARTVFNLDGSNNVLFGDTGNTFTADTYIGAGTSSSVHFKTAGTDRGIIDSNSLRILGIPFQLDNAQDLNIKDNGGTARTVVSMDASNQVLLGDTGNTYTGDTYLAAGTSSSIHFKTAGSDRGIIDASSLRLLGVPLQMDNNQPHNWKDSGGTARAIAILDGSNIVKLGDSANAMSSETRVYAGGSNAIKLYTNGTQHVTVPSVGGLVVGTAALATNATDGFLYIPTCAGAPTVGANTQTGTAAIEWDSTNDQLLVYDTTWNIVGPHYGTFGDGSDGTGTFDASATPSGTTKSGADYTLTRDVYYTNATLSASATINPAGFRIFVNGTLTVGSGCVIKRNGNAASSNTAGALLASGTIGGAVAGGAGVVGNGSGTAGNGSTVGLGATGGTGGSNNGGGGTGGGVAATAVSNAAAQGVPRNVSQATLLNVAGAATLWIGGGGGSGGNSTSSSTSGGGGGGGGVVAVYARLLVNSGTIQANGGNGGNASGSGSGAGGGGAGGGGTVVVISTSQSNGTVQANGGTGGSRQGNGNLGANGSNGTVYWLVL